MGAQTPETQAPPGWKRVAFISASAGAGFAVTLALIASVASWYNSRPKPPRPWNTSALKATWDSIDTEGDRRTVVLYYTLENRTDFDYKVESGMIIAARLAQENSLITGHTESVFNIDYPIFIPAKLRVKFAIHLTLPYPGQEPSRDASFEERSKYRKAVRDFMSTKAANLNGIVLFDEANRYQINFPKGW